MVAQPLPDDAEGASPRLSEDEIDRKARVEEISLQHNVEISFHDITETFNVPINDGSSTCAYTLDLIAPPNLTSEITQYTLWNKIGSCLICVVKKTSISA